MGSSICSYFCGDCILPDKLSGTGDRLQPLQTSSPPDLPNPQELAPNGARQLKLLRRFGVFKVTFADSRSAMIPMEKTPEDRRMRRRRNSL